MLIALLVVALLGVLPTFALARARRVDMIELVALLHGLGASALLLGGVIGHHLGAPINALAVIAPVMSVGLAAMIVAASRVEQRAAPLTLAGLVSPPTLAQGAAAAVIGALGVVGALNPTVDILSADTTHHLAYIKRFAANPVFSVENIVFSSGLPYDLNFYALAGNSFQPVLVFLQSLAGLPFDHLFLNLNGPAFALLGIGVHVLTREAVRSGTRNGEIEALFAVVLLGLIFITCRYPNYTGHWFLYSVAYPSGYAASLITVSLALVLATRSRADAPLLIAGAILWAASITVHLQWLMIMAVTFAIILAVRALSQPSLKEGIVRAFGIGLVIAVSGLFALSARLEGWAKTAAQGNSNWREWPGLSYMASTPLGDTISISALCTKDGPGLLAALLLVASVLWSRRPGDPWLAAFDRRPIGIVALLPIIIYALIFLPPLPGLMMRVFPQPVLLRAFWFTDVMFCVLFAAVAGWVWAAAATVVWRPATLAIRIATASIVAYVGYAGLSSHASGVRAQQAYWKDLGVLGYRQIRDTSDYFQLMDKIPSGARMVVFQKLPLGSVKKIELARTDARVVEPIYDLDRKERELAAEFKLDGKATPEALRKLIAKHKVQYMVSWVWPGETEDPVQGKGVGKLVGESRIPRPKNADVTIRLYDVREAGG